MPHKLTTGHHKQAHTDAAAARDLAVRRFYALGAELRAPIPFIEIRTDAKARTLEGYAAKFGTLTVNMGYPGGDPWREALARGCFRQSLVRSPDVVMLLSHNANGLPLARCDAGTLDVGEDSVGLRFSARLSDSEFAQSVFEAISRREIKQMSFAMQVRDEDWDWIDVDEIDDPDEDEQKRKQIRLRMVTRCDLLEISPVIWAAYPSSEVSATSRAFATHGAELRSGVTAATQPSPEDLRLSLALRFAAIELKGEH